jgi:hypothetical protein
MAYRTSPPNPVLLVCGVSFLKQQSKGTQRSINWPHLEKGIKSANLQLPPVRLKLHLTVRKGTGGGNKCSVYFSRRQDSHKTSTAVDLLCQIALSRTRSCDYKNGVNFKVA